MQNNYTTNELNEILLGKKVEDFYMIITSEIHDEFPSEEEAEQFLSNGEISPETQDRMNEVSNTLEELFGCGTSDINRFLAAFAECRHRRVVVMVDDMLYDVASLMFVDLTKERVLRYDPLSDLYNNENCRPMVFPPEKLGGLVSEPSVTLDYDDLSQFDQYKDHINDIYDESLDLRNEFEKVIGLSGTSRTRTGE